MWILDKTKTGKKGRKISGNSHSILFINMVDGGAKEINGGANLVKRQHVTIKAPDKKRKIGKCIVECLTAAP